MLLPHWESLYSLVGETEKQVSVYGPEDEYHGGCVLCYGGESALDCKVRTDFLEELNVGVGDDEAKGKGFSDKGKSLWKGTESFVNMALERTVRCMAEVREIIAQQEVGRKEGRSQIVKGLT